MNKIIKSDVFLYFNFYLDENRQHMQIVNGHERMFLGQVENKRIFLLNATSEWVSGFSLNSEFEIKYTCYGKFVFLVSFAFVYLCATPPMNFSCK